MHPTKQEFHQFLQRIDVEKHFNSLFSAIPSVTEPYIICQHCGNIVNLKEAKMSGYNSEHSLRHIHCSGCGRIIKWSPGDRNIVDLIEGICGIILGGALAYLLYPHLNFYGLQAGFFTSIYGLLKVLIS